MQAKSSVSAQIPVLPHRFFRHGCADAHIPAAGCGVHTGRFWHPFLPEPSDTAPENAWSPVRCAKLLSKPLPWFFEFLPPVRGAYAPLPDAVPGVHAPFLLPLIPAPCAPQEAPYLPLPQPPIPPEAEGKTYVPVATETTTHHRQHRSPAG